VCSTPIDSSTKFRRNWSSRIGEVTCHISYLLRVHFMQVVYSERSVPISSRKHFRIGDTGCCFSQLGPTTICHKIKFQLTNLSTKPLKWVVSL
jgi:hypothetical protein